MPSLTRDMKICPGASGPDPPPERAVFREIREPEQSRRRKNTACAHVPRHSNATTSPRRAEQRMGIMRVLGLHVGSADNLST